MGAAHLRAWQGVRLQMRALISPSLERVEPAVLWSSSWQGPGRHLTCLQHPSILGFAPQASRLTGASNLNRTFNYLALSLSLGLGCCYRAQSLSFPPPLAVSGDSNENGEWGNESITYEPWQGRETWLQGKPS